MKYLVPSILMVVIAITGLTACAGSNPGISGVQTTATPASTPASTPTGKPSGGQASNNAISTGLGIVTGVGSSTSASAEKAGNVQVDSLIAVVTLDSNSIITRCTIDAAQTKVSFNNAGKVTADKTAEIQTKNEKGDSYGMKRVSAIGKDWFEQAAAFSEWTVGKTVAEVSGLKTKKVDDSHTAVPDVPELTSSVTISVGDFIEAVEKAAANAKPAVSSGDYKTGLGVITGIGSSKDASADAKGVGQVDSLIVAVTVDESGKIVACSIDNAQTKVNFDATGTITSDLSEEITSKNEKGDAYGMKKVSSISKEWFEQAEAFAEWTIGKTLDDVKGLKTKKVDESHTAVPDVPELTSSVTVTVGDFISGIEKAIANAK